MLADDQQAGKLHGRIITFGTLKGCKDSTDLCVSGSFACTTGAPTLNETNPRLSHASAAAIAFLRERRNSDGGWGYLPGNPSVAEPTCYAAMCAGSDSKSTAWILRNSNELDGGSADPQWTKSLALLTLDELRSSPEVQQRLQRDLLGVRVKQVPPGKFVELDGSLRGWAWVDDTFSWVEPTSFAVLALKKTGHGKSARVQEAERLLLDRACADGGWNYGNPKARGLNLDSMPPATALAAIALQDVPSAAEQVKRALNLLDREMTSRPSALGLALSILCFHAVSRRSGHLVDALLKRQQSDGSWRGQVHLTALAVLALRVHMEGQNVFRLE
jgi:hypothetical protein